MDQLNPFETRNTFRLHRGEYLLWWLVSVVLIIVHFTEIRWLPFIALFLYIDLIGYIPGAIAYHRSKDGRIAKGYFIAYNVMHSLITQSVVLGLWLWLIGPEWALLALPFHLFGDRALFGNFLKPFGLAFEPKPNKEFTVLVDGLTDQGTVRRAARPLPVQETTPSTA